MKTRPQSSEEYFDSFGRVFIHHPRFSGKHPFRRKGAEQAPLRTAYSRLPHAPDSSAQSRYLRGGLKEPALVGH